MDKMTFKAMEETKNKLIQQRRSKLAQLTGKMREIEQIQDCDDNLRHIRHRLRADYQELYKDFEEKNDALKQFMTEEEFKEDQLWWNEPVTHEANLFIAETEKWIEMAEERVMQAKQCDEEVKPSDRRYTVDMLSVGGVENVALKVQVLCHPQLLQITLRQMWKGLHC